MVSEKSSNFHWIQPYSGFKPPYWPFKRPYLSNEWWTYVLISTNSPQIIFKLCSIFVKFTFFSFTSSRPWRPSASSKSSARSWSRTDRCPSGSVWGPATPSATTASAVTGGAPSWSCKRRTTFVKQRARLWWWFKKSIKKCREIKPSHSIDHQKSFVQVFSLFRVKRKAWNWSPKGCR